MAPAFLIRRATLADLPIIVEFNCRLAEETEGKQLHRPDIEAGVAALLADERKGRYFVAVLNDCGLDDEVHPAERRVVGQLMHTCEWSDWRNGDIWWLQSVYVDADYRRHGVFRALIEHLRREAETDVRVVGLRLYVEEQNIRAQATYARLGLQQAGYVVMQQMLRRSDLSP